MGKFEENNPSITLNILNTKEKEICSAYISKIHLNCEKQIILLKIPNEEKKRMALSCSKKLSASLITYNLEIIAIIQVNKEAQRIVFVI